MTFGFSTTIDALSWAIALLLGWKVVATIVLLSLDKDSWFQAMVGDQDNASPRGAMHDHRRVIAEARR